MAKLPQSTVPPQQQSSGDDNKFDPIPENSLLDVVVEDCKLKPLNPEFKAKFNIQEDVEVEFRFRVQGPQKWANRVVWGSAKPYWEGENSRLRLWTKEILGVSEFPVGYEFDTDDLVGLKARILISNYTKKNGDVGEKVKDVIRAVEADEEEPF